MRKEVAQVRKKIDSVNRDLKPLGQSCQKKVKPFISYLNLDNKVWCSQIFMCHVSASIKDYMSYFVRIYLWIRIRIRIWIWIWIWIISQEKEYKDALEAYNEKNKEKVQLISKLMEVSFDMDLKHISQFSIHIFSFQVLTCLSLSFFLGYVSGCAMGDDLNSWWVKVRGWGWRNWRSWVRT